MAHWQDRFALTGRRAFVTGASKGIGAEICALFAEAGADIVALARDADGLAETARAVKARGRTCLTIAADLANPVETVAAAEQALKAWGTMDIGSASPQKPGFTIRRIGRVGQCGAN